jgi:hypothetical protein
MVEELGPAAPVNHRIVSTLKKLENDRTVLVRVGEVDGVLLTCNRNGVFKVEKVPGPRLVYMTKYGYILAKRRSAFDELGWLEFDLTYDGMMIIRAHT